MMNKKGMTLIELLVYMVLAAMVLAPIIMLVQNSSVSMARDAGRSNLQLSGREILQIMYDDLKNTGFKLSPDGTGDVTVDTSVANFYMGDYELVDDSTGKKYKIGYTKLVATGGSQCNDGFTGCRGIIDPFIVFRRFAEKRPSTINNTNKDGTTDLGVDGYGCRARNSCEFIRDSSSYYSATFYMFTSSEFSDTNRLMIDGAGDLTLNSVKNVYTGNIKNETIVCYDTLGVRMLKLDKDGNVDGASAYQISYKVRDTTKHMLVREVRSPHSNVPEYKVLARNVAALKFRYSDNLKDWYDYFNKSKVDHVRKRNDIQYIKIILVLRDPKKLAATNPAQPVTIIAKGDVKSDYSKPPKPNAKMEELILTPKDQALYERFETVVPIPNNGLFP
jgi:type II secretory pathway pseudopilin PulG